MFVLQIFSFRESSENQIDKADEVLQKVQCMQAMHIVSLAKDVALYSSHLNSRLFWFCK